MVPQPPKKPPAPVVVAGHYTPGMGLSLAVAAASTLFASGRGVVDPDWEAFALEQRGVRDMPKPEAPTSRTAKGYVYSGHGGRPSSVGGYKGSKAARKASRPKKGPKRQKGGRS